MKIKTALIALLLGSTLAFGKDYLTDGEIITSDVSDSWIKIGRNPQTSKPPYEIVNVTVAENVSLTASSYLMIYENNSITFKGSNKVLGDGTISVKDGASLYAENSSFELGKITFMGNNTNMTFKNCTINTDGFLSGGSNYKGNLVLDGTEMSVKEYTGESGTTGYYDSAFNIILKNKAKLNITDSPSYGVNAGGNIYIEDGSSMSLNTSIYSGSDVYIGSGSSFTSSGALRTNKTLSVSSEASVSASDVKFEKLTVVLGEDLSEGATGSLDLESIFGSSASIVLSALEGETGATLTLRDSNGQEWSLSSEDISGSTISYEIGAAVPEPSTYAAIFGAIALGFAIYRKRK